MTKYKRAATGGNYEKEKEQLRAFIKAHNLESFLFLSGLNAGEDLYDRIDKFDSFLYETCQGDTSEYADVHEQMLVDCELGCDGKSWNPNGKMSGIDWIALADSYVQPDKQGLADWLKTRHKTLGGGYISDKMVELPFCFRTISIMEKGAVKAMEQFITER